MNEVLLTLWIVCYSAPTVTWELTKHFAYPSLAITYSDRVMRHLPQGCHFSREEMRYLQYEPDQFTTIIPAPKGTLYGN